MMTWRMGHLERSQKIYASPTLALWSMWGKNPCWAMEAVAREREMEFSFQWKPPVIGENLFSDEASIKTLIEGVQRTSGASLHGSMVKKKKKKLFPHANRETMETVTVFIFLGSEITSDGDCSHKIKRCLLLGRKAMTNLDKPRQHMKNQGHYFANKDPYN